MLSEGAYYGSHQLRNFNWWDQGEEPFCHALRLLEYPAREEMEVRSVPSPLAFRKALNLRSLSWLGVPKENLLARSGLVQCGGTTTSLL